MTRLALIWRAAGLLLATDARSIVEVLPPLQCRPTPGAPDWIRGLFGYRGDLIPLVDSESLLRELTEAEGPQPADRMQNRVLVLRAEPAADRPSWLFGLWVPCLLELEKIDFSGTGTHPGIAATATRSLGAVAQTRFGFVQLFVPDKVLRPEHVEVLCRGTAEGAA